MNFLIFEENFFYFAINDQYGSDQKVGSRNVERKNVERKMSKGKNTERKNNKTEICRNTDPHVKTCRNEK